MSEESRDIKSVRVTKGLILRKKVVVITFDPGYRHSPVIVNERSEEPLT